MAVTLAVDYGRRRIGLAVTDALGIAGMGLPTLKASGRDKALDDIAAIVAERNVAEIVVGLPLNMDGSRGPMAEEAAEFAAMLGTRTGVRTVTLDERLTTQAARQADRLAGGGRKRKKVDLDRTAATLILNDYLQSQSNPGAGCSSQA